MSESGAEDNWLRAARIACPRCRRELFRVDHSPHYDDILLYCDRCANRVEISLYDPVYDAIAGAVMERGEEGSLAQLRAVEARLRPCACGGRYRHDAPRRCDACLAQVIVDEPGVDLWPGYCDLGGENREPTDEEVALIEQFEATYIRRRDVWQD
jgi:hypothetical protein